MRKLVGSVLMLHFLFNTAVSQEKWNLKTIVDYAMANNISVRLSEVQSNIAALTYRQSKLSQLPLADLSLSGGVGNGSNQNQATFSRITQSYFQNGFQLQTSANIFNFFSKRNTIAGNEWEALASKAYVDKMKNDIALTAANAYLQILLAKEQENITRVQVQQTEAQLTNTRKLVDAGALPELNASQLEAQLASDSVNYLTAKGNVTLALLTMKSYMSIDAATPFEVDTPPVEKIPIEAIADLQPDDVFRLAVNNQPLQQYNSLRLKAAEKFRSAARAATYPSLSAYGSVGSTFNNRVQYVAGSNTINSIVPTGSVDVNGGTYIVYSNIVSNELMLEKRSFPNQYADNFRQSVGLTISIPLLSGYNLRTQYARSKENINTLQLQKEQDNLKLKQDIYQAYTSALTALEKFNASKKAVDINEKTYEFANKRFEVGLLGTYDLITTQNNLLTSKLQYTINQFDYVFKMKVLEFYKGLGLKL